MRNASRSHHEISRSIAAVCRPRQAFTLIELLVVIVILSILASLSLAGLAGARQRAKADKTRSTIRKIDAVIRPMYDSYLTRRVDAAYVRNPTPTECPKCYQSGNNQPSAMPTKSWKRLVAIRNLSIAEMPDCWPDVVASVASLPPNAVTKAYNTAASVADPLVNGPAETLYLIIRRSGFEPDALELFRADELGDTDKDGAAEFIDGWLNPIGFLRWAPGFESPIQKPDPHVAHDPLDPLRLSESDYATTPLIVSGGPDGSLGITALSSGWLINAGSPPAVPSLLLDSTTAIIGAPLKSVPTAAARVGSPALVAPTDHRDNITNHDLTRR
jgi:prepilin-type N-terminal cleavage/methylation domain-containing protein